MVNTQLVTNVGVMAVAIGALTKGLDLVYANNLIPGCIAIVSGIILLVVYEKLPTTPAQS